MGLEKLTNAFGILMLFQGFAAMMGTPIAGELLNLLLLKDAFCNKYCSFASQDSSKITLAAMTPRSGSPAP